MANQRAPGNRGPDSQVMCAQWRATPRGQPRPSLLRHAGLQGDAHTGMLAVPGLKPFLWLDAHLFTAKFCFILYSDLRAFAHTGESASLPMLQPLPKIIFLRQDLTV